MRIIYVHTNDLAKNETSETFVIYHSLSLALHHQEVLLILINNSAEDASAIVMSKFNLTRLPDTLKILGYKNPTKSKRNFHKIVAEEVGKMPASVVIIRHHAVLKKLISSRQSKHRYVFETHDFFYDLGIRDDVKYWKKRKRQNVERNSFKKLDALMHLNPHQKELYDQYIPAVPKIVLPTGLQQVHEGSQGRKDRIVYIGSLNARLGSEWLIKLAGLIPNNYELVIIGGKTVEEIDNFKDNFVNSALPENVKITGWIDKKEIENILVETKVGLLPLTETFFNKYLTVPLKLLDYISYGIPVISSDHPSVRSIIDSKSCCFINWNDLDKVIEQIVKLVDNNEEWCRMSKGVYRLAKTMTWSNRASLELDFLSNLLSKNPTVKTES
ncbi:MAG: glycosyltransferase family 4 protein [Cytophagales bacterium]|nr:glycosyltransferase family 4 protein [Cytophagales bacterium]